MRLPDETFTFLGVHVRSDKCLGKRAGAYLAPTPAEKKVLGICDKISEETSRPDDVACDGEAGAAAQSDSDGLGQLLPSGLCHGSLAGGAAARLPHGSAGGCDGSTVQTG